MLIAAVAAARPRQNGYWRLLGRGNYVFSFTSYRVVECQTWADDALLFRHFRHEDKPFNKNALHALVGGLDFKGQALPRQVRQVGIGIGQVDLPHTECCQSLDGSLRHFLSFFRLPGEAPLYSLNMLTKSNSVKFLKLFFTSFTHHVGLNEFQRSLGSENRPHDGEVCGEVLQRQS